MAIAVGASASALADPGTSLLTTSGVATTASGSTFIVFTVNYGDENVAAVTDNKGNTYTRIGTELDNTGDAFYLGAWISENGTGGSGHTASLDVTDTTVCAVYFVEVTGGLTSGILDVNNSAVDSSSPFTAAVTPTSGNRLLLSFITGNAGSGTVTYDGTGQSFTSVQAQTAGTSGISGQVASRSVTGDGSTAFGPNFTASAGSRAGVFTIALKEAGGSSVTKTPTNAVMTLSGQVPDHNAFQFVRIREVLINESGQPIASAANITLKVWYSGYCSGPASFSINGQTTDANGTTSWSISTGTLTKNSPIFYVAQDSLSFSNYTCARMIPSYE